MPELQLPEYRYLRPGTCSLCGKRRKRGLERVGHVELYEQRDRHRGLIELLLCRECVERDHGIDVVYDLLRIHLIGGGLQRTGR